jgi:16S rRNA (cytosine967-C5)-methyltransferase
MLITRKLTLELLEGKITFEHSKINDLTPKDRNFIKHLYQTIQRKRGLIDHLIAGFLEKPLPKKGQKIRNVLYIGATQLLFMNTESHAAIHTSVDLIKKSPLKPYASLTNAMLRKIQSQGNEILATLDQEKISVPNWIWKNWSTNFGEQKTRNIIKVLHSEPPTDITVKKPDDIQYWAESLNATIMPTGSLRLKQSGAINELPGHQEGAWWVQDIAASLPVKILAPKPGMKILDVCAAPGGKTAQLAASGATVTALDISESRLSRLEANLKRLNLQAKIICDDFLSWQPSEQFDAILLDAPCSATGTFRRHPDRLWSKQPEDLQPLVKLQAAMIKQAITLLKPQGKLVYAVCSLEPKEGIKHANSFTSLQPQAINLPELDTLKIKGHQLQTFPSDLMDGFYIASFKK